MSAPPLVGAAAVLLVPAYFSAPSSAAWGTGGTGHKTMSPTLPPHPHAPISWGQLLTLQVTTVVDLAQLELEVVAAAPMLVERCCRVDNCPRVPNPSQANRDQDAYGKDWLYFTGCPGSLPA